MGRDAPKPYGNWKLSRFSGTGAWTLFIFRSSDPAPWRASGGDHTNLRLGSLKAGLYVSPSLDDCHTHGAPAIVRCKALN